MNISKEKSARVAEDLVPAAAAQIARNFVMCSCFTLKCPDKACVFLPRSGVLPGSPFIVRVWVHTFKRPVLRLRTEDRKWNPNKSVLVVTSPAGVPVDVGTSVYADDVMRLYATLQAKPHLLIRMMMDSSQSLDRCFTPYSLTQNKNKRMIVPFICGSRKTTFFGIFA